MENDGILPLRQSGANGVSASIGKMQTGKWRLLGLNRC